MNTPASVRCSLCHSSVSDRTRAFTLVELLTVIAIIGVLAAILIPVLAHMRASASSAHCTAQMRKIGMSLQLAVQEKRGALPTSPTYGNLHTGQGPWFNRDDRRLQNLIGTYLESPAATTWSTSGAAMDYDKNFAWPGWESGSLPGAPSVVLNTQVKFLGSNTLSSPWAGTRAAAGQPYTTRRISDIENPANERVFIEVDQQNTTAGWSNLLPAQPVHRTYRNALFFDWHVGRVALN